MTRFENAIRKVGGFARLPGGTGGDFAASIQPMRADDGSHSETGVGYLYRSVLYTSCGGDAALLREGSVIEYQENRYIVEYIEDFSCGGVPAYRRGIVVREQKGDY